MPTKRKKREKPKFWQEGIGLGLNARRTYNALFGKLCLFLYLLSKLI